MRNPLLVPFWLLWFWPILEWRSTLSRARRHIPLLMLALVPAVLCWFYPTEVYVVIIMSLVLLVSEPLMRRSMARGQRSHEILRQIDERAEQFSKRSV